MESTQVHHHNAWNKGKLVGQKAPFKLKEIWSIRVRLEMQGRLRELVLFDLGIDSKLRACDLLSLRVCDVCHGDRVAARAIVLQQKTQRPVQFEITTPTREVVAARIKKAGLKSDSYLFPSRVQESPHLGTRQYARIVDGWVEEIGLDSTAYGTHSMRRTKPTLIYRRTKNLRAVQLLLGHTKLESTVRYLGIEVDDALRWRSRQRSSLAKLRATAGHGGRWPTITCVSAAVTSRSPPRAEMELPANCGQSALRSIADVRVPFGFRHVRGPHYTKAQWPPCAASSMLSDAPRGGSRGPRWVVSNVSRFVRC